jgi:hypothetical protein
MTLEAHYRNTFFLIPKITHNNMADTRNSEVETTPVTLDSGPKMMNGKQT